MAFIDIPNPTKREEIVREYIKTRNEIRDKNENNKESNLLKERAIEEKFRPIVTATEKSAEKIASVLKKNEGPNTPYEFYSAMTKNKDKYFSIYRINDGSFRLGDTDIQIDGENNIHISGTTFKYTPGLFDLLMLNKPDDGDYTEDDLDNYKEIVKMTNLIDNPRSTTSKAHYKNTSKYKFLENLFYIGRKRARTEEGSGVILPGDINSLKKRLQLVCAERAAGNIKATTPEIVAILDELLRQNYISKAEYNEVCERLGC